jgi:hypothetical protein
MKEQTQEPRMQSIMGKTQFSRPSLDMEAYWKECLQEEFHAFCPETGTEKVINHINKYYGKSTKAWFEAL